MPSYETPNKKRRSHQIASNGKCPGQDLNLHALRRCHLKAVRLPIPPPGLWVAELYARVLTCREWNDPGPGDQEHPAPGLCVHFVSAGEGAEGGQDRAALVE